MIIIEEIWPKMVKNGRKWSKMVKNDQKWSKMVKNGQKWSKMIQNGHELIIDILLRTTRFIIQTTRFGGRTGSFEKLGTECDWS